MESVAGIFIIANEINKSIRGKRRERVSRETKKLSNKLFTSFPAERRGAGVGAAGGWLAEDRKRVAKLTAIKPKRDSIIFLSVGRAFNRWQTETDSDHFFLTPVRLLIKFAKLKKLQKPICNSRYYYVRGRE